MISSQDVAPDEVVEIDELKFGCRKYHCGCHQEDHWVYGGMERGTCNAFTVEFQDRSATTLLPIIKQHVLPGRLVHTTVLSDEWRAYRQALSLGIQYQQLPTRKELKVHGHRQRG